MNAVSAITALRRGPDFQVGAPLEQRLMWLDAQAHDPEAYAMLFLGAMETVGSAAIIVEESGEYIEFGVIADEHDKERARWLHALSEHLEAAGHRHALLRLLFAREKVGDARPRTPAGVTRSIRDYLATGGNILVTPEGVLSEKVTIRLQNLRTDEAFAEAGRATRAYRLAGAGGAVMSAVDLTTLWQRDPNDAGWGFGRCRRRPPTIIKTMVKALRPKQSHNQQVDREMDDVIMTAASLWPATHSSDWCGEYDAPDEEMPLC